MTNASRETLDEGKVTVGDSAPLPSMRPGVIDPFPADLVLAD